MQLSSVPWAHVYHSWLRNPLSFTFNKLFPVTRSKFQFIISKTTCMRFKFVMISNDYWTYTLKDKSDYKKKKILTFRRIAKEPADISYNRDRALKMRSPLPSFCLATSNFTLLKYCRCLRELCFRLCYGFCMTSPSQSTILTIKFAFGEH